jgi:serine/threonine protein phosphatase PrpC
MSGAAPGRIGCTWAWRSVASAAGTADKVNQDNLVIVGPDGASLWLSDGGVARGRVDPWPPGHCRFAVLDGMGAHRDGARVSAHVARALAALPAFHELGALSRALDRLHADTRAAFADGLVRPAGTTLLVLEVPANGAALLYHVGDSRLFRLDNNGLDILTVDHCPATARLLRGELDAGRWQHEVYERPHRELTQAFGLGRLVPGAAALAAGLAELCAPDLPDFISHMSDRRTLHLNDGAVLLLATDGLWSARDPARRLGVVADVLRATAAANVQRAADGLLAAARADTTPALDDNLTFIVMRRAAVPGGA